MSDKPHLGVRILMKDKVDWASIGDDEVLAMRVKAAKMLASPVLRFIAGRPDSGTRVDEHFLDLPGRRLRLRVFRPVAAEGPVPLVLSFHGGGFIGGSPEQNDWVNSRMSAALEAVVVGVDYRLAPEHPLPAPVEDGMAALDTLAEDPFGWHVDPERIAVFGESAGGTIAALLALRSREEGPRVRAQALVYPGTDWSETATEYPSMARNGSNPGLSVARFRKCAEFALPPGIDGKDYSPVKFASLAGAPPALVAVGGLDAVLDHGCGYVERLRAEGTDAEALVYPRATHGFMSTPGLVAAARPARDATVAFLAGRLRPARARR